MFESHFFEDDLLLQSNTETHRDLSIVLNSGVAKIESIDISNSESDLGHLIQFKTASHNTNREALCELAQKLIETDEFNAHGHYLMTHKSFSGVRI